MKNVRKILSLALVAAMLFALSITTFAEEHIYNVNNPSHSVDFVGAATIERIDDTIYSCEIDCNTVLTFNSILDELYVSEGIKGGDTYYSFYYGEEIESNICTINKTTANREDIKDRYNENAELETVTYMLPGTTLRFNVPGEYNIIAFAGAESAFETDILYSYTENGKIDNRTLDIIVTVSGEASSVNASEMARYDENLISVSGITGYDYNREIMYDYPALCAAPLVIEAKTDLANLCITPIEMVNGQWEIGWEPVWFDELEMNDMGFTPVKAGTKISFSTPGIYELWAEKDTDNFTGLIFEITASKALYTSSKVLVDGKEVKFEAYNINGNNYFKLRDIACAFMNTEKEFEIQWDGERNKVTMTSGRKYTPVGGELVTGDGTDKLYQRSENALVKDGSDVSLNAFLINGNNYFKLRDLGRLFDFNVSWDGANNCVMIDTTCSYMEE